MRSLCDACGKWSDDATRFRGEVWCAHCREIQAKLDQIRRIRDIRDDEDPPEPSQPGPHDANTKQMTLF